MESEGNDGAARCYRASRPSRNDALLHSTVMSTGPHMEEVHAPGDVTPAVGTKHGSNAILTEDELEIVIPFLVMKAPAYTMCDQKEGRTPILKSGEHMHVWCFGCAELPSYHHCEATHDACPDCRTLRTIIQLSRRWEGYMWDRYPDPRDDHMWDRWHDEAVSMQAPNP